MAMAIPAVAVPPAMTFKVILERRIGEVRDRVHRKG